MSQIFINIITSLITGGVISTIVIAISERRKRKAETDNMIVEGAKALLEPLTRRVSELETQVAASRKTIAELTAQIESRDERIETLQAGVESRDARITDLESEVAVLREQVKALGGVPERKTGELRSPTTGAA